ncbi:FAD-dependent 5-carboxymethylaminomethyl-2-thiouridine(34) oxidoreductase MnmC [Granulosicoccus antarcticus]|uniref:tRNA 5-methylaminomethyl-2-thiouridine biosynthesis bifunctional protein MnmC n=1 Tax=Granulosicoccus antarcticus IMCC3135 TaxID=1192854 RepID=A0A2Z2P5I8_9GAMM|nr:FAD-dependent 5-carboxymethylaminomethyl-2-thiouridine(34) oxidoreductase MnmC [Granulosicoccus antarcticus]ASJ75094.1 tRNA 5-methylaminomethyl-2-thiouridine biosynthesis bifunctional protein MnmC [Granulosicoccus antarcticus IMCC3135]
MNLPWNRFESATPPLTPGKQSLTLPFRGSMSTIEPVIIIGAGLAGCWTARLLAEHGLPVRLIDSHQGVAHAASGNPAGIVKPYVTRTPCLAMDFHVAAHQYLLQQLRSKPDIRQSSANEALFNDIGVLQLVEQAYPESAHYGSVTRTEAQTLAGLAMMGGALHFKNSGWLNPGELCRSLVKHPGITLSTGCTISSINRIQLPQLKNGWQLVTAEGKQYRAVRLVLASGSALNGFQQTHALPITAARGQISRFGLQDDSPRPQCVVNGKHYIIPDGDTVLVGATFDRDIVDERVNLQDHTRNLSGLRQTAPSLRVHDTALAGYAGVRATTPDRLPMVGPAPDTEQIASVYADLKHGRPLHELPALPCHEGLYVLGGLGSRGIVSAPLAANILTQLLMHLSTESWKQWAPLLNPARFQIRDIKRGKVRTS